MILRADGVEVNFKTSTQIAIQHLAFEITELKVYGEQQLPGRGNLSNLEDGSQRLYARSKSGAYLKRSLPENSMNRLKQLIDTPLTLRIYKAQTV